MTIAGIDGCRAGWVAFKVELPSLATTVEGVDLPAILRNKPPDLIDLKRKLVGVTIRTPASVREPVNLAFLVAIEDFVAGFARNPELPAQFRHGFTRQPPSHKLQSFIHNRTLPPRHCTSSPELVMSTEEQASTGMMGKGTPPFPIPHPRLGPIPLKRESVTYVSGTKCYPCVGLVIKVDNRTV
jgi:hypothetical protein